jgi:small-conductance mechanosensitive channel
MGNTTKTTPPVSKAAPTAEPVVITGPAHEVHVGAPQRADASAPVAIKQTLQAPASDDAAPSAPAAPPPAQPAWGGLLAVLLVATMTSLVLVRLGRMRVLIQLKRWMPLAHLLVWGLALLFGASLALATFPPQWLAFMALAAIMLGVAGLSGLRSALAGLGIALEGKLSIGDTVQIGALHGEIVSFGLRAVRLRSPNGMIHDIPNERFMSEAVSTLGGAGGEAVCEIAVTIPATIPVEVALELAREGVVLSPLSSPRHRPEVFLDVREDGQTRALRIRGYAFDPDYHDHFRSDVIRRVGRAVEAYQSAA